MSKHRNLSTELRSAFINPQIPGTLYLEASFHHKGQLQLTLRTLSSVRASTLAHVPKDDVQACLRVRGKHLSIPHFETEWVSIKRGLYRGDVGVVVGSYEKWGGMQGTQVVVVPRLLFSNPSSQKRKRGYQRPPPRLFDPSQCVQGLVHKSNGSYVFENWTFEAGFLCKTFHLLSLEPAKIMPSELLPLFRQSTHPLIRLSTMPIPAHWSFQAGEHVMVSNGVTMVSGIILETAVGDQGACLVDTDEGHKLFPPFQLVKDVKPGDFVEIVAGEHAGKAGFVLSRNQAILAIAPGRFGVDAVCNLLSSPT